MCSRTFVSIKEVVICGIGDGFDTWPMPFENSVNFLALVSRDFRIGWADGNVVVIYSHLPHFLVIKPYETKVIKVPLSKYWDIISTSNWRVGGDIFLAMKDLLDYKIKYDFPSDIEKYYRYLDYSDTVTVIPKTFEKLRRENKIEGTNLNSYEKLNDVFIVSPGSEKNN